MRAKMFLDEEKRSPTRCTYYEARLAGVPVRAGEGFDRYDGTVRPDDVRGVMHASGLRSSVERHVRLRECGQGWTDSQMIIS